MKKLLANEPLTFEDNVVFCLVGQREEHRNSYQRLDKRIDEVAKRLEAMQDEITDVKIEIRDLKVSNMEMVRRMDDIRKEMVIQTRWTIGVITPIITIAKFFDFLK